MIGICAAATLAAASGPAVAAIVQANGSTYRALLPTLRPGDTLQLAGGTYTNRLEIVDVKGTESAPITIEGPMQGAPAVFEAQAAATTIEITNSHHVVVQNLTVDGKGLPGVIGVGAGGGAANASYAITVRRCIFSRHGGSEQTVAIATRTPTFSWVITGNEVLGAGSGIVLGEPDGSAPFVAGVIESNLVRDPLGYALEIKHQAPWPPAAGLPAGEHRTVIRNNVFIKNDATNPDGDRPTVMVGGFPDSGAGASGMYEIHGNLFAHNARASLLQASGRVSIHDNIFIDAVDIAVSLRHHNRFLALAHVYNNTIYAARRGIHFGDGATGSSAVVGNLVFAESAISGPITDLRDNVMDTVAAAAGYVMAPSVALGTMDFYPSSPPGAVRGAPLDLGLFAGDSAWSSDFNGTPKGMRTYRGAYAGEGPNPGWRLADEIKAGGFAGRLDGGVDGSPRDADGSDTPFFGRAEPVDGGCVCRLTTERRGVPPRAAAALLVVAIAAARKRRRRA